MQGMITGVAAAAMACSMAPGQQALQERRLPGFSVKVPGGVVEKEKVDDYADGIVKIQTGGGLVMVTWHPPHDTDSGEVLRALLAQMGATSVRQASQLKAAGLATHSVVGSGRGQGMAVSSIRCGEREILLWTRLPMGAETLHERMLASFQCFPDAVRDAAAVAPPPVVVKLPPGWQRSEAGTANIGWQGEQGSVTFRMVSFSAGDDAAFVQVTNGMLRMLAGRVDSAEDLGGRRLLVGHVTAGGRQEALAIVVPCEPRPLVGLYIGNTSGPLARDLLLTARCE